MRADIRILCRTFILSALLAHGFSHAKVLPIEHFAHLPDVQSVQLSPGGKKIASVIRLAAQDTNGTAIRVTDLTNKSSKIVLFSNNSKYFIGGTSWKDDTTLFVYTWYPADRDTWIGMGSVRGKTRETRLLIVNTETATVSSPFKKSYLKKYRVLPTGLSRIIDPLPGDPDHILMSIPGMNRGFPSYPIVTRVNIKNQQNKTIQSSEMSIGGWGTDEQHNIRLSYRWDDKGRNHIRVRDAGKKKWRELWSYEYFSADEVNILGFDYDPNIIYISAYHNDLKAVFKVDLRDKQLNRELIYSDPKYDVSGFLRFGRKTKRVIGIGAGMEEGSKFIVDDWKSVQARIDQALPDTRNFIYNITDDENLFMVYSTGTQESGTYYLGSVSPLKIKAVAYRYEELTPDMLGQVQRIDYTARDGLEIESYLTLPKNSSGKNLPTLMFPHGGPIARDSKSFDYWAQFFANRGYAVLQMNFRGSAGQGLEFRNSGLQKWGKEMQDDIEDGALELIERGITDPQRICIVGASYGGYAALMGVAKTPDRYQCAISVNGVSNVYKLVLDNRAFWRSYNVVDEQIGRDARTLRDISPVNHADKIKAPVLLIHGELDRQVEIDHSYQMRDALQKEDKTVIFIEQTGEDHYLSNEAMRVQAFEAMANFLDTHLPTN